MYHTPLQQQLQLLLTLATQKICHLVSKSNNPIPNNQDSASCSIANWIITATINDSTESLEI